MAHDIRLTYFADPERVSKETLERQRIQVGSNGLVAALLDGFPEPAAVLNSHRQIVLANDKLAAFTSTTPEALVGLRLGEAIGCEYGYEEPAGCGTTAACALCGAAKAIEQTRTTRQAAKEECRITMTAERSHEALDFGVWTSPVDVEGEPYMVFAIRDTSAEQRRRVLERMFFHDVLNSAGGLYGLLQVLPIASDEEVERLTDRASHLAAQVVEEIQAQRDLSAAERGELRAHAGQVDIRALLEEVVLLYQHHSVAEGKSIVLEIAACPPTVETDSLLLRRVLGNLVKNALEASHEGETVTVRYRQVDRPVFEVHNAGVMTEVVKLQVFRRSFSTKGGHGRGIGTYSARLLAEHYLGGQLTFESEEGRGTTFTVALAASA